MPLPLDTRVRFGLMTKFPNPEATRATVAILERVGFDSAWTGDHLAYANPILDPLLQLAQVAAFSTRLTVGPAVYLLPLRHPGPVAKQVATLDHLSNGRVIFGVGVGGEFASDYAVAGVPMQERGARLSEGIEVLRKLWSGERVSHAGRFYSFDDIKMEPTPVQRGGPPIWCGGRSDAALARAGRLADGYMSYVVTPDMYRAAVEKIGAAYDGAGRSSATFATSHLLFLYIDDSYDRALERAAELLSKRYAMDFRKPAQRYAALGTPEQVAQRLREFHAAGVRHFNLDFLGSTEERDRQIERFAREVRPLLDDLARPASPAR